MIVQSFTTHSCEWDIPLYKWRISRNNFKTSKIKFFFELSTIFHERPLRIDKFTYDAGGGGSTGLFGLVSMTVKSKNMFHLTSSKPTKRRNMRLHEDKKTLL